MFGDLSPVLKIAGQLLQDSIDSQIDEAEAHILSHQRKLKLLKAQRVLFAKFSKELSKPPKPFKPPKLTKQQKAAIKRARAQGMNYAIAPVSPVQ